MSEENRKPLSSDKVIRLTSMDPQTPVTREFIITGVAGYGGSAICYNAFHNTSGQGILKEFYPTDVRMKRDIEGILTVETGLEEELEHRLKRYLESYEDLTHQMKADTDLGTFIPSYEIYRGTTSEEGVVPTAYIWEPTPEKVTFEALCVDVRRNPHHSSAHRAYQLLSAVNALTQCIGRLHHAGFIHRDIKPSNFGFIKRNGDILTDAISLFDIDTVCRISDHEKEFVGTKGYLDESGMGEPCPADDIYSIGAVLFRSVIVTGETAASDGVYRKEYYPQIADLVEKSELLRNLPDAEAGKELRQIIARILQRSLGKRSSRYECCEDLSDDIRQAMFYLSPYSETSIDIGTAKRWELKDMAPFSAQPADNKTVIAIGCELCEYPLYQTTDGKAPRILLCGFDQYGQKYLDVVLQLVQFIQGLAEITVIADPQEAIDYLEARRALSCFFEINNKMPKDGESYGSIRFLDASFPEGDRQSWVTFLQPYFRVGKEQTPDFTLIATGNDSVNVKAARAVKELSASCNVSFIRINTERLGAPCDLHPIDIGSTPLDTELFRELERMAFNTHLIWERNLDVDFAKTEAEFRNPYNYFSNMCSALAVKYKLHSAGIDLPNLDSTTFFEAAEAFRNKVLKDTPEASSIRNFLIWSEHKRWVAEMLCTGWAPVNALSDCLAFPGTAKIDATREHACICRSRQDHRLHDLTVTYGRKKWDEITTPEEIDSLDRLDDSLDRLDWVSLGLHILLRDKLETISRASLVHGDVINKIKHLIVGNVESVSAFNEWYVTMAAIAEGNSKRVGAYSKQKQKFLDSVQSFPEDILKEIEIQLRALEREWYVLLEFMRYTDYKAIDARMIDNIPFVLTYTTSSMLVVPFRTGNSTAVFGNVAAATVINPQRIAFISLVRSESEQHDLLTAAKGVQDYMKRKKLRAEVEMTILYDSEKYHVKSTVTDAFPKVFRHVAAVPYKTSRNIAETIRKVWEGCEEAFDIRAMEQNDSPLSMILDGADFFSDISSYSFDSDTMQFSGSKVGQIFSMIPRRSYLDVEDIVSLQESHGLRRTDFDFSQTYQNLWDKFKQNSVAWKSVCTSLEQYAQEHDRIAAFPTRGASKLDSLWYILPPQCLDEAERIATALGEYGVIENFQFDFVTYGHMVRIILYGCRGSKNEYSNVFGNVTLLSGIESVRHYINKNGYVQIAADKLSVHDAIICTYPQYLDKNQELLRYFEEQGYISGLMFHENSASFRYASDSCKKLLTTAGMVLELYVYYKALETGQFDDIVGGFEVEWARTGVKSEFDCVLTKGFRSLFVECKARPELKQDFYYKLAALRDVFGVNTTAVLIGDTEDYYYPGVRKDNIVSQKRGDFLDIITVSDLEGINDIGNTLLQIIESDPDAECVWRS